MHHGIGRMFHTWMFQQGMAWNQLRLPRIECHQSSWNRNSHQVKLRMVRPCNMRFQNILLVLLASQRNILASHQQMFHNS